MSNISATCTCSSTIVYLNTPTQLLDSRREQWRHLENGYTKTLFTARSGSGGDKSWSFPYLSSPIQVVFKFRRTEVLKHSTDPTKEVSSGAKVRHTVHQHSRTLQLTRGSWYRETYEPVKRFSYHLGGVLWQDERTIHVFVSEVEVRTLITNTSYYKPVPLPSTLHTMILIM